MKADLLSVIEAIYADAVDEQAWLKGVAVVAEPLLDRGFGVLAHTVEHRQVMFDSMCAGRVGEPTLDAMIPKGRQVMPVMHRTPGMPARLFSPHPFAETLVRRTRHSPDLEKAVTNQWLGELSAMGICDIMGVIGGNPDGCGAVLFAPCASVARPTTASNTAWARVAAHLAAGYRLRVAGKVESDAVLDPDGRMAHSARGVSADERNELTLGVRSIDRARGKLRRVDENRALSLWKGLVAGRWSLVDQFDHDGRRYVLARRNAPAVRAWRKLTDRETHVLEYASHGQPHKVIAYELGVSVASVGADLASAAAKVGARSRLELVTAYRAARRRSPRRIEKMTTEAIARAQ